MRGIRRVAAIWGGAFTLGLALAFGPNAARADELTQSFTAASDGQLTLRLEFGSVELVRHDGDEVQIEATARGVGASGVHFAARAEGGNVYFQSDAEPWVRWLRSAPGVRVRATLPRGVRVHVDAPASVDVRGEELTLVAR